MIVFATMVLSGCGARPDASVTQSAHETVAVVTSFFPLAKIVATVGGEYVTVDNLAGGQEVHTYTPSPRDLQNMRNADLVVVLGGVEPWVADVVLQMRQEGRATAVISEHVPFDMVEAGDGHAEEEAGIPHDHDGDPHVWVDPVHVRTMTQVIADALVQADPEHAQVYRANAAALAAELDAVDAAYRTQLGACTGRAAMISHEAFGYIARRYGVTLHPIAGLSTMDEPSAKLLAALRDTAQRDHVTHILAEQNSIRHFADVVARGSGLTMMPIDALERATEHNMASDYPTLLLENLTAFTAALACPSLGMVQ